jgi:hypothetical protein
MEVTMATDDFRGISFEDARRQAELEQLIAAVAVAERDREPIGQRHRKAERDLDTGLISEDEFQAIDDQYIAANNKIAAAKRAVDAFLGQNPDYKSR